MTWKITRLASKAYRKHMTGWVFSSCRSYVPNEWCMLYTHFLVKWRVQKSKKFKLSFEQVILHKNIWHFLSSLRARTKWRMNVECCTNFRWKWQVQMIEITFERVIFTWKHVHFFLSSLGARSTCNMHCLILSKNIMMLT